MSALNKALEMANWTPVDTECYCPYCYNLCGSDSKIGETLQGDIIIHCSQCNTTFYDSEAAPRLEDLPDMERAVIRAARVMWKSEELAISEMQKNNRPNDAIWDTLKHIQIERWAVLKMLEGIEELSGIKLHITGRFREDVTI